MAVVLKFLNHEFKFCEFSGETNLNARFKQLSKKDRKIFEIKPQFIK